MGGISECMYVCVCVGGGGCLSVCVCVCACEKERECICLHMCTRVLFLDAHDNQTVKIQMG